MNGMPSGMESGAESSARRAVRETSQLPEEIRDKLARRAVDKLNRTKIFTGEDSRRAAEAEYDRQYPVDDIMNEYYRSLSPQTAGGFKTANLNRLDDGAQPERFVPLERQPFLNSAADDEIKRMAAERYYNHERRRLEERAKSSRQKNPWDESPEEASRKLEEFSLQ